MNKKHQENIESYQESQNRYEERINYFEKEYTEQQEDKIRKVMEEKESVQSKWDTYKKEQKDKDL